MLQCHVCVMRFVLLGTQRCLTVKRHDQTRQPAHGCAVGSVIIQPYATVTTLSRLSCLLNVAVAFMMPTNKAACNATLKSEP